MTAVIRSEDLTKRYRRLCALDRVNLEVQEGAIYALVGPNGAGKTTSIKILMNLISATGGHAAVLGVDSTLIRGKSYTEIGYVSENQEIPGWMKVGALLEYLRGFYPAWDRELEDSLLKQFDFPRDRKIRALSRGMKMKRAAESTVFISSHDLAEIESFASHVGYLEQGTLRFSEEMTSLAARFREVEITCEGESRVPSPVPASWLQVKSSAGVVRFVENQFTEDKTAAEIRRIFGEVKNVEYRPMGLRAIFLAMARKGDEA